MPQEDVVREVFEVLEDFREHSEFQDEYKYYESIIANMEDDEE